MKKTFIALGLLISAFAIVTVVYGQMPGSGSFRGTDGTTPVSGTFTVSGADPCSSGSVAKSSVAVLGYPQFAADLVAPVAGKRIYVCGFEFTGSAVNGEPEFHFGAESTAGQCASHTDTPLTGNMGTVIVGNNNQTVLSAGSGLGLCVATVSSMSLPAGFVTFVQK